VCGAVAAVVVVDLVLISKKENSMFHVLFWLLLFDAVTDVDMLKLILMLILMLILIRMSI
jgi:hypothetical protein